MLKRIPLYISLTFSLTQADHCATYMFHHYDSKYEWRTREMARGVYHYVDEPSRHMAAHWPLLYLAFRAHVIQEYPCDTRFS